MTPGTMPAITLWQPWATMIAIGAKRVETRSWRPPARLVGQRIAIHAAVTRRAVHLVDEQPFRAALQRAELDGLLPDDAVPLGAVVCTAVIERVDPVEHVAPFVDWVEIALGDYSPGRFGWRLVDVEPLREPLPWKGRQGWFEVQL
jgi:hypothetical protein